MSIQNSGFTKELQKSKQRIKVKIKMSKSHCLGKFDHCIYRAESDDRMDALNFYFTSNFYCTSELCRPHTMMPIQDDLSQSTL